MEWSTESVSKAGQKGDGELISLNGAEIVGLTSTGPFKTVIHGERSATHWLIMIGVDKHVLDYS